MSRSARSILLLIVGIASGAAALFLWQSRDESLLIGSMIASFERKNELVVFAAHVVPVVTQRDEGLIDLLDTEQTAIIPASVNYTVDLSKLTARDVAWDANAKRMTVTVPPVMIQPPNLFEQRARYYRKGVWVSGAAQEGLFRGNSTAATRDARRLARDPNLVAMAEASARDAVAGTAQAYLSGAGLGDAEVVVRFAHEGNRDPSQLDRSRPISEVIDDAGGGR